MTVTKNVSLDPEKYNQLRQLTIRGVKVKGALSPYDTPRQARATYDQARKEFRIELIYLTPNEPKKEIELSREIFLFMGQSSGKLYEIVIRGQESNTIKNLQLRLVEEVGELAEESERAFPHNYVKFLNLLAAKKVLEEKNELYDVG